MQLNWKHQTFYAWAFAFGCLAAAATVFTSGCGEVRQLIGDRANDDTFEPSFGPGGRIHRR